MITIDVDSAKVSDGYHTFEELYEHRVALFVCLANSHKDLAWRSKLHHDETCYKGYYIAGMKLPTGDITYHLPDWTWYLLDDVETLYKAPEWDGHTANDVVARLQQWAEQHL